MTHILSLQIYNKENRKKGGPIVTLKNKLDYIMSNEDAFSFTEFVVWTSVILLLAVPLFVFRETIEDFFSSTIRKVGSIGPKY